ncbi:MAG: hypothetical protein WBG50_04480 [Desulfomonilaceae bacterium]
MDRQEKANQPFRFKRSIQQRIYQNFYSLVGPGPAEFYRDACKLMETENRLASTVNLVAHLFREIEAQLRSVLVTPEGLEKILDKKANSASKEVPKLLKTVGVPDNDPVIPACGDFVPSMVRATHRDQVENILSQLGIRPEESVAKSWLKRISSETLPKYAHSRILGWTRELDDDFENMVEEWEAVFDFVLERFQARYMNYHKHLDNLLSIEVPTDNDIRLLRESVPNNIHALGYFFGRLSYPAWLPKLKKKGFFSGPRELVWDEETSVHYFPPWPQGQYLTRMAPQEPQQVLEILMEVDDKRNPYVRFAVMEAATKMPRQHTVEIVPKVKTWLRTARGRFLTKDCVRFLVFLANAECVEEGLDLAEELLSISQFEDELSALSQELMWDYSDALTKVVPPLIDCAAMRALHLLCDLLDMSLALACGNSQQTDGRDRSDNWREQIEVEPERGFYELQNSLVTAVRDASVRLARRNPELISSVIHELEGRSWLVFYRLALHVLCEVGQSVPEILRERLIQFHRYDDYHFWNEYYRLGRIGFPHIDSQDQNRILTAIEAGTELPEVRRQMEENGQEISEEAVQLEIRKRVRNRLGELRPVLNESWLSLLEGLESELGPSVPLVIPLRNYAAWSSPVPKEAREFGSMAVTDIVSFLESWGPPDDDRHRSPDKVCRLLVKEIANDPEKFEREAQRFQQVDPTYIRHTLQGFREAFKAGRVSKWNNVISLCRWVVSQGREISGRAVDSYWDQNWANTRREILALVDEGLRTTSAQEIPFSLKGHVWSVLEPLTLDPEPTTEDESQMLRERQDPAPLAGVGFPAFGNHPGDVASNSLRPLAIRTAVSYGMWVRRNMSQTENPDQGQKPGFEEMPEVREVLDYHLDPQNDSSISVAYLYGKEFRCLYVLDRDWVEENKARIFAKGKVERERGAAAWGGYLLTCRAPAPGFDVLQQQYERAVKELGRPASETGHFVNLDLLVGEHLRELYRLGKIALGDPGSIWEQFFEQAGDEIIGILISNIGRDLFKEDAFPEQWLDKLRKLWEWRISRISADRNPAAHRIELKAFGAWFGSGKFDDVWALNRLLEVLQMNDEVETHNEVVHRLSILADQFSGKVLDCAIPIVRGVTKNWKLHYCEEDLKTIISVAESVEEKGVRQKGGELKSILLSKGRTEYA